MDANLIAKISAIIAAHPAVNERLMIGQRLAADDLARKVIAAEREKCATVGGRAGRRSLRTRSPDNG